MIVRQVVGDYHDVDVPRMFRRRGRRPCHGARAVGQGFHESGGGGK